MGFSDIFKDPFRKSKSETISKTGFLASDIASFLEQGQNLASASFKTQLKSPEQVTQSITRETTKKGLFGDFSGALSVATFGASLTPGNRSSSLSRSFGTPEAGIGTGSKAFSTASQEQVDALVSAFSSRFSEIRSRKARPGRKATQAGGKL